uniref:Reverse transcriptase domain-containing protein n=1 Tax=Knipowitschia caucasica TaxID=637954 RepID=A0AAV2LNP3_KNICA
MFFDFSCALNTIRLALLQGKMEDAGVDSNLPAWTIDYLSDRPQYVRLRSCESQVVVCSTGAPQGTVLSPFLFTIYTELVDSFKYLHRAVEELRSSFGGRLRHPQGKKECYHRAFTPPPMLDCTIIKVNIAQMMVCGQM